MSTNGVGFFRGFNIAYPEYTVITPQTGLTYNVRSLKVSEVSRLKSSSTTPAKTTELINKTIWEAIVDKPSCIKTYDDFLKMTTLKDREALMFGVYVTTFGESREFTLRCASCGANRNITFDMNKLFSFNAYPGSQGSKASYAVAKSENSEIVDPETEAALAMAAMENGTEIPKKKKKSVVDTQETENTTSIIGREEIIELPISKIKAVIFSPTILDEQNILRSTVFAQKKTVDLLNDTLIVKRFEVYENGQIKEVVDNREDILMGYQELPPRDKEKIYEVYRDNFANYGVEIKSNWDCLDCGSENTLDIDIVAQFFRMVALS